jgi:hypothetical protein
LGGWRRGESKGKNDRRKEGIEVMSKKGRMRRKIK